eukprot:TRINITY_DN4147_c0_g4_i1.p1 TRINITY_DN4147_c0_g4~~TRINITY_DN4147_c0_g4_i1.p1  ORF type:complete len:577 (+),score=77.95 TRINITY_DN4147_c0_g4_i1:74-1732(+)
MSKWCVTFADLVFLRKCIKEAIEKKEIVPTARDQFDPTDDDIGPSMYTCNDQYIKPITEKAGSMSWALMFHPEGLECDLFITHAWIEGIFEFIDKVLNSWPSGKKACYMCMLSNPQNLDINALISCPIESPFAKCLETATHMLVVPNRSVSIYSRLWCVYEAWLAYERDKVILTARAPVVRTIKQHAIVLLGPFIFGLLLGGVGCLNSFKQACINSSNESEVAFYVLLALGLLSALLTKLTAGFHSEELPIWSASNFIGILLAGILLGTSIKDYALECTIARPDLTSGSLCLGFTLLFYFLCSEADCILQVRAIEESKQLSKDFTSVKLATCSEDKDNKAIRKEIEGKWEEVNSCVDVLRAAGMSTKRLRAIHSRGVCMEGAAYSSLSNVSFCLTSQLLYLVMFLSDLIKKDNDANDDDDVMTLFSVLLLDWFFVAMSLYYYYKMERDQRAFAASCTSKILMVLGALITLLMVVFEFSATDFSIIIMTWAAGWTWLLCTWAGMDGLSRIWIVGVYLAELLGPGNIVRCCSRRYAPPSKKGAWYDDSDNSADP